MAYPYNVPVPAAAPIGDSGSIQSPYDRLTGNQSIDAQLGFGLLSPFRRDEKNDFAKAGGVDLVRACVAEVLGVRASSPDNPELNGELPWNPEFGSLLYTLRHKANSPILQELAHFYVSDALKRWEPRVRLKFVAMTRESTPGLGENKLVLRIKYDFTASAAGNDVVFSDVEQAFTV